MEPESKTLINIDWESLSPAEIKAVILMRDLKPYQQIQIKLHEKNHNVVCVTRNETLREDFSVDTV